MVVGAVESTEKALKVRIGVRVRLLGVRGIGIGPLELSRALDVIDGVGDGNRPGNLSYCDEDPLAIEWRRTKCRYGHGVCLLSTCK